MLHPETFSNLLASRQSTEKKFKCRPLFAAWDHSTIFVWCILMAICMRCRSTLIQNLLISWPVMEYGNMDTLMKRNACVTAERIRHGTYSTSKDSVPAHLMFMMRLFNDLCTLIHGRQHDHLLQKKKNLKKKRLLILSEKLRWSQRGLSDLTPLLCLVSFKRRHLTCCKGRCLAATVCEQGPAGCTVHHSHWCSTKFCRQSTSTVK